MKVVGTIAKILVALAAVAGAVYVVATYGNQIVVWAKKLLASLPCSKHCKCEENECVSESDLAEEVPAEDPAVAEEVPVAEEVTAEESAVVAEENDFEG